MAVRGRAEALVTRRTVGSTTTRTGCMMAGHLRLLVSLLKVFSDPNWTDACDLISHELSFISKI